MSGDLIDLNRRFRSVSREEAQDPSLLFDALYGGLLSWADLKKRRRVVILAEAGSGKTSEFKAQWCAMVEAGEIACYAMIQDLGRSGLEDALGAADIDRFEAWKTRNDAVGWFFLDSVDEAKDEGVQFEAAVRNLGRAIAGREERARILISGRFTDWDFIADRKSMEEWLAIPQPPPTPEVSYQDQIRATLQYQRPEKSTADPEESMSVVLMIGLDEPRVCRYARRAGVADIERFIQAVELGNLWHFASRPLDLEWMVDYWHQHGRLGSLAEMLKASIDARLVESKPGRKRRDSLGVDAAKHALERIGAGLLLCGKDAVRVPSESVRRAAGDGALPLETLLPDLQPDMLMRLLGRPVFDPATLGRVRLHNDNEATVRSYLTAQWLRGRLAKNCPPQQVDDLLFADLYGYKLARPDMLSTAAWLSIWNPDTADKLIAREPLALLTHSDPGALRVSTRIQAIEAVLRDADQIDRRNLWPTHEALRRFADPAFDSLISRWWANFASHREARHLLLQLIWLGRQSGGLYIVRTAAFDMAIDTLSQQLAGNALMAIGTSSDASAYADHIVAQGKTLPRSTVLNALDNLFPKFVSVDQFFSVIDGVGLADEGKVATIWPLRSELVEKLNEQELTAFLAAILQRTGPVREDPDESEFVSAFASIAVAASLRLLHMHADGTPDATDLVLRLHSHSSYRGRESDEQELRQAIGSSPQRRRQSFWRAAEVLRQHPWIQKNDELSIHHLPMLGWPGQLTREDLPWLLEDVANKPDEKDRRLAFEAAYVEIWRNQGKDAAILDAIAKVAERENALQALLTLWQSPKPESPELIARSARLQKAEEENRVAREKRDNSWITFIDELRANPALLDRLQPQTETKADSRLVHLGQFLLSRTHHRSRYAIDDLSMVEPIFGPELTKKFGAALITFAYARWPLLPSERSPEDKNKIYSFDSMGLAGMSLAAATRSDWAETLSTQDAERAARYAIIELNGFPDYFQRLADVHPAVVRRILAVEVSAQLAGNDPAEYGILGRLTYADAKFAQLVAPDLEVALADEATFPQPLLLKLADVLIKGIRGATPSLPQLVWSRATTTSDPTTASYLLSILFAIDGEAAADTLRAKIAEFDEADKMVLCSRLLPRIFGSRTQGDLGMSSKIPFATLEELVLIAYDGIRPENDVRRSTGEVYSPDWHDDAQEARNAAFGRLIETPGEATHAALIRLSHRHGFPISAQRLRKLARERAEKDAVLAPWRPEDVTLFEQEFDHPPSTTADLQHVARRRAEQIARDLHDGRFALGDIVQALPDENAVQRWFADRYELLQGNAFTVVRESHVADEKEPDITLTSRASAKVSLPIEVKVIDGMTVPEMVAALEVQLCGQYLRHSDARHGVLLLLHQKARPQGWVLAGRRGHVPLKLVLEHLNEKAREIRARSPAGPQPIVVCVDVSTIPHRKKAGKPQRRTQAKRAAPPSS